MDLDMISIQSSKCANHAERSAQRAVASALIIPNFDRALHILIAHLICARLRD